MMYSQRDLKKTTNDYLSTQTIMSLIQKINSQKQSIGTIPKNVKSPTQQQEQLSFKKILSAPKTERTESSDQATVTILLFDIDKTVTEFKFDSLCGTTDQLISFLTN
jgi:hypothetical protein